jgi:hypothetical protein
MSDLIPEEIILRIQEFKTLRRTGHISLNFFEGEIMNADANEHIALPKNRKALTNRGRCVKYAKPGWFCRRRAGRAFFVLGTQWLMPR